MKLNIRDIFDYFSQPFPYKHKKWQIVVVPSLCVFIICLIFRPYRFSLYQSPYAVIFYTTLFTAAASAIVAYIFPLLFKKYYDPNRWTRGKFFSYPFFIVTILVLPLMLFLDSLYKGEGNDLMFSPVTNFLIWSLVGYFIAFFPTFIIYHIVMYRYRGEEKLQNEKQNSTVTISGDSKEQLKLIPVNFLYAEVKGNYVTIHYLNAENILSEKSLRITLSRIMSVLEVYPRIKKVHRAFLVNTAFIKEIKRKQHNLIITLHHTNDEVPLSRSYLDIIRKDMHDE